MEREKFPVPSSPSRCTRDQPSTPPRVSWLCCRFQGCLPNILIIRGEIQGFPRPRGMLVAVSTSRTWRVAEGGRLEVLEQAGAGLFPARAVSKGCARKNFACKGCACRTCACRTWACSSRARRTCMCRICAQRSVHAASRCRSHACSSRGCRIVPTGSVRAQELCVQHPCKPDLVHAGAARAGFVHAAAQDLSTQHLCMQAAEQSGVF